MKEYPSIVAAHGQQFAEFDAHLFEKLDGQNVRAQWSAKTGWYKFGSRHRLVELSDPEYGPAVEHFHAELGAPLAALAKKTRARSLTVFMEWFGPTSLGGFHTPGEELSLAVFDAFDPQKGFLSPNEFRKLFEDAVPTPRYLGPQRWTRGYVQRVRAGEVESSFEGVVAKNYLGTRFQLSKAKTQAWLDAIHARFDPELAAKLANS